MNDTLSERRGSVLALVSLLGIGAGCSGNTVRNDGGAADVVMVDAHVADATVRNDGGAADVVMVDAHVADAHVADTRVADIHGSFGVCVDDDGRTYADGEEVEYDGYWCICNDGELFCEPNCIGWGCDPDCVDGDCGAGGDRDR